MDEIQGISITVQGLLEEFLLFLPKILAALVIFIVGLYLANLAAKLVRRALLRRQVNAEATQAVSQVTRWSLVVLVAITALQQVDFNLSAFIAGLGIVGFTVGFALKDISENFMAGLLLLLQRPFELGDVVEIEEYRGRITDVTLRATEMITMDGHNVTLPNGMVYTNPILNYTRSPFSRIAVEVGVAYNSDLDHVRDTALQTVGQIHGVLDEPPPYVVFHTFADSSINLTVFYWVAVEETPQFRASDLAVPVLKKAFEEAGIEIPFPVRTVLLPAGATAA